MLFVVLFDYVNADLTSGDPDNPFRLYDYSSSAIAGKCDFVGGFVVEDMTQT